MATSDRDDPGPAGLVLCFCSQQDAKTLKWLGNRSEQRQDKAHSAEKPECTERLSLRDPGFEAIGNTVMAMRSRL
jgi:hypothetical protein